MFWLRKNLKACRQFRVRGNDSAGIGLQETVGLFSTCGSGRQLSGQLRFEMAPAV